MKYKPKGIQKMPDITYYQNMKDHPEFGTKPANFPARISMKKKFDKNFDGSKNHPQIQDVIRGKVYQIMEVITYGNDADFVFINEKRRKICLNASFFEEPVQNFQYTLSIDMNIHDNRYLTTAAKQTLNNPAKYQKYGLNVSILMQDTKQTGWRIDLSRQCRKTIQHDILQNDHSELENMIQQALQMDCKNLFIYP